MYPGLLATAAALLAGADVASAQLNSLARAAGLLYFGTAVDNPGLSNAAYMRIAGNVSEFGQITPANGQKWESTEATRAKFDYAAGDAVADVARRNGQFLRCHTLVWHSQLPSWVGRIASPAELIAVLKAHISNEVGHYRGQCYAWDVVNEAFEEDGSFRDSIFHQKLGTDFAVTAFYAAAEADPYAKLYYNDYNLENPGPKQDAAVRLVKDIKFAGARIDGVGLQGHFIVGQTPVKDALKAALARFSDLDVDVAYTELDIRHAKMPPAGGDLQRQSIDYQNVVLSCVESPRCVGVTVWDFADQYSWVPSTFEGQGGATLFDDKLAAKPAYSGVLGALRRSSSVRSARAGAMPAPWSPGQRSTITATATAYATVTVTPGVELCTNVPGRMTYTATATAYATTTVTVPAPPGAQCTATGANLALPRKRQADGLGGPGLTYTSYETETEFETATDTVLVTVTEAGAGAPALAGGLERYQQCGGSNYNGPTQCAQGLTCSTQNPYYAACN